MTNKSQFITSLKEKLEKERERKKKAQRRCDEKDKEIREMKFILPAMPYGLCAEERGWRYTVSIQSSPSYLGDGAEERMWKSSNIFKEKR